MNRLDFSGSALRANTLGARGSAFDQLVDMLIVMFAIVKFYLLFSFLFGVGFAVQMRRVEGSGRAFVAFYSQLPHGGAGGRKLRRTGIWRAEC